jgi:hypothetical protein
MFPEIRISWPLLLAAVVVTLTVMVSFHLADAGQYTTSRVFPGADRKNAPPSVVTPRSTGCQPVAPHCGPSDRRPVVQISFLTADGTGLQQMTSIAAKMKFEGLTSAGFGGVRLPITRRGAISCTLPPAGNNLKPPALWPVSDRATRPTEGLQDPRETFGRRFRRGRRPSPSAYPRLIPGRFGRAPRWQPVAWTAAPAYTSRK